MIDSLTANGIADIYFHKVFSLHGFPKKIISDQGPQFAARSMRQILKRISIDSSLTMAYHPQANGQIECKNQEVKMYLHLYTSCEQDNWSILLPMAEFCINAHRSSASNHTPFKLIYDYTPNFMIPPGQLVGMPHVDKCLKALKKAREEAQATLRMSKDQMKMDFITQPKKPYKFKVRDMVWLQAKNVKVHQQSQKLGPKQLGLFAVIEVLSDLDYRLQLSPALKLHDVFYIDHLSP
jgi:hypothetical protein